MKKTSLEIEKMKLQIQEQQGLADHCMKIFRTADLWVTLSYYDGLPNMREIGFDNNLLNAFCLKAAEEQRLFVQLICEQAMAEKSRLEIKLSELQNELANYKI